MSDNADWPAIPFEPWKDSCAALHLQTQIVGKCRLRWERAQRACDQGLLPAALDVTPSQN
jgi:hypothetical protein